MATIEDDMKKVASIDFSIAAPYMNKLKPIGMLEIIFINLGSSTRLKSHNATCRIWVYHRR